MIDDKWDRRFLDLAEFISGWSKDPSSKVGAVIARPDRTIVSVGFNGFPRGVSDRQERYDDRPTKYLMVVHAEANAILTANEPLSGYTIYTPLFPCAACAAAIIQSGIERVVTRLATGEVAERWRDSFEAANKMFEEAGVQVDQIRPLAD